MSPRPFRLHTTRPGRGCSVSSLTSTETPVGPGTWASGRRETSTVTCEVTWLRTNKCGHWALRVSRSPSRVPFPQVPVVPDRPGSPRLEVSRSTRESGTSSFHLPGAPDDRDLGPQGKDLVNGVGVVAGSVPVILFPPSLPPRHDPSGPGPPVTLLPRDPPSLSSPPYSRPGVEGRTSLLQSGRLVVYDTRTSTLVHKPSCTESRSGVSVRCRGPRRMTGYSC